LDETQAQNDVQLAAYRKKHQDAVNQLTEQIDKMHSSKQRSEQFPILMLCLFVSVPERRTQELTEWGVE